LFHRSYRYLWLFLRLNNLVARFANLSLSHATSRGWDNYGVLTTIT
jgi:hypothetical protein